jgi:hypothetical protein
MGKSLQKPTNGKTIASKNVSTVAIPQTGQWVVRSASTGRFAGMAKNIEKIDPVIIPGYKIRG